MDIKKYSNSAKPIYCVELDEPFPSASKCAKELGISLQNIRKVLKGQRQTCHGYHFYYVTESNTEEETQLVDRGE